MSEHLLNRIREIRTAAGMSQEQLGELIGTTKQQVGRIENGGVELNLRWMRAIARAFHCAPADLLTDQDNPYRLEGPELELVDMFRALDRPQRDQLFRVIVAFCFPANENHSRVA